MDKNQFNNNLSKLYNANGNIYTHLSNCHIVLYVKYLYNSRKGNLYFGISNNKVSSLLIYLTIMFSNEYHKPIHQKMRIVDSIV